MKPTREEREKQGAQIKEYILEDSACPLAILMKHPANGGQIIFQIRRCTPDILAIRKAKKKAEQERELKLQAIQAQSNTIQQQQQQQQQMNPRATSFNQNHQQTMQNHAQFTNGNFQIPIPESNTQNSSLNNSSNQQSKID